MTEAAPALRLHSVMLGVTDVDASVAFYTERLGFALCGRFGGFAFVDVHGTMLTLSQDLAEARPPAPAPVELVLAVDGVRDAYAQLCTRGVTFLNAPHLIDGTNEVANFQDPDGHHLSLYGKP